MADIARAAGVSRQTLYKEFGSRDEFSAAFVIREGERFLDAVEQAVREHLDDPRAAVAAALEVFLVTAGEDPLMRILLSDDGTGGMLPLVTTQSMPVVTWASARLAAVMRDGWPQAAEHDAQLLAETLVRLAISYVTVPRGAPAATAADAARCSGRSSSGRSTAAPDAAAALAPLSSAEPAVERERCAGPREQRRVGARERRQRRDLDVAEPRDRRAVVLLHRARRLGPRRHHHAGDASARRRARPRASAACG